MSESLEDNESRIIPPATGNTQNEYVEPLIGTEHTSRVIRSVSSDPKESALPPSGTATPVRPALRRSTPRVRHMSLSLIHVGTRSAAKVTFMLFIAVAIIWVVTSVIVWVLLGVADIFSQITQTVSSTDLDAGGFDLKNVLSLTTVVSGVTIFSIVEAVILTLLAIITALIYNVVNPLVGSMYVTLGDN